MERIAIDDKATEDLRIDYWRQNYILGKNFSQQGLKPLIILLIQREGGNNPYPMNIKITILQIAEAFMNERKNSNMIPADHKPDNRPKGWMEGWGKNALEFGYFFFPGYGLRQKKFSKQWIVGPRLNELPELLSDFLYQTVGLGKMKDGISVGCGYFIFSHLSGLFAFLTLILTLLRLPYPHHFELSLYIHGECLTAVKQQLKA